MTPLRIAQALSADAPASGIDWKAIISPILGGTIIGLVCYNLAKKIGVSQPQAKGVALAMGAVTAVGQIASSWLKGWTDKAIAAANLTPTVVAEAPPPETLSFY